MLKPSEVVGRNVRAARALRNMNQEELALAMERLGHDWTDKTVGSVENASRRLDVDELFGLALALGRSIPEMLENSDRAPLDCGLREDQDDLLDPRSTNAWTRGQRRLWAHDYGHLHPEDAKARYVGEDDAGHGHWILDVQEVES